jgi:hypothetical protein
MAVGEHFRGRIERFANGIISITINPLTPRGLEFLREYSDDFGLDPNSIDSSVYAVAISGDQETYYAWANMVWEANNS